MVRNTSATVRHWNRRRIFPLFAVKKCYGIELFPGLHQAALQQQQRLRQLSPYAADAQNIYFFNANVLDADFSDATLIFINATAFIGETWDVLNQRLGAMTTAVTVITTSKKLSHPLFSVINTVRVQMSWGVVTAYIQRPTPFLQLSSATDTKTGQII